ncbi:regulator of chromosome condensation 1/beta-lactamase-inhibitor protein II [Cercophora scortea]|uniref:Regulator of chromosome condensation 1/beta-lactamase-inhibitor protein II n=1 Tax=Cercophora scortea TaxID=314031 RepID=A0AAE0I9V8_9PEZI|nr:regulator of chromosome condensation 1/beta-lactamase-inhibitor protein II [Cercophora scortea]
MELWAAGFNAWNQLRFPDGALPCDDEPEDISVFTRVLTDNVIDHVEPYFSYTWVHTTTPAAGSLIRIAGFVPQDHNALRTAADDRDDTAHPPSSKSHFVEASNGVVVAQECLHQYPSIHELLLSSSSNRQSFPGFPSVTQLVAYETGFAALSSTGQVWTWGDERYAACLGRDIDDASPAHRPGLVSDLEDLPTGPISKLAAGGYILAALTEGNDLYCWGHPGRSAILEDLSDRPSPVVIEDNDIADIGIGAGHLLTLTVDGELFVLGDNTNGQLGLPQVKSTSSWTRVDVGLGVKQSIAGVVAGPRSSFLIIRNRPD